ncbi:MAG: hypothetical protein LBH06_04550 [Rikenellaceae bacterium]|jgi:hypothetical protein|nr:hypothetical protein [Rikenellaceae bacterium]
MHNCIRRFNHDMSGIMPFHIYRNGKSRAASLLEIVAVDDLLATERDYILALADMRAAGF